MSTHALSFPHNIYGVDFSGADNAGKRIWISSGIIAEKSLCITDCRNGADFLGSRANRESCLEALKRFISGAENAAFGLDFPFGLPRELVQDANWEEFIESFPHRYRTAEAFREACRAVFFGKEKRRKTDVECGTPFSPYNLRLFKQTYFGISHILSPLVRAQKVCVLPMQQMSPNKPWVIEICPASTLKKSDLYGRPYKGRTETHRNDRITILTAIEKVDSLLITDSAIRRTIIEDHDGDALDSAIAALATYRAVRNPGGLFPEGHDSYKIEGYVYV